MTSHPKTILTIHAHPEHTETFNSGVLKLLRDRGYNVFIATLTAGGMESVDLSQCKAILTRKKEAANAAKLLGAEFYCFDIEDGFIFDNEKIRMDVAELIRVVNPGIIFTHFPFSPKTDHRTTSKIVEIAAMMSTFPNLKTKEPPLEMTPLLYYTSPPQLVDTLGNPIATPHFCVNIVEAINKKMEMLSNHHSQVEATKNINKIDSFFERKKMINKNFGKLFGIEYAEIYWQNLGGSFPTNPVIQKELIDQIIEKK